MKKFTILIFMMLSILFVHAQNKDVQGSKDYDLLGRMPDYNIRNYWDYQFDAHEFFITNDQRQSIEGRKIIIRF
jgi:hypothetical protein